ncbi:MAG: hypothetical protein WC712_02035 [Candidatus Brocadiia bacterium]
MFEKQFSEMVQAVAPRKLAMAGVTSAGQTDAFFARASSEEDYDDEPRPRRAGKLRYEPGKKRNDTTMIIGIVAAVLVLMVVLVVVMQPKSDLKASRATLEEMKLHLLDYARGIHLWAMKFNEEKGLYPPATEDAQPGSTFFSQLEFEKLKINPYRGYRFYYSPAADRKSYVLACVPENVNTGDKSYYVYNSDTTNEDMVFEADWKSSGDFEPPQDGKAPKVSGEWTRTIVDTTPK